MSLGKHNLKHSRISSLLTFAAIMGMPNMFVLGKSTRRLGVLLAGCACLTACGAGADTNVYAMPLTEAKAKIGSTKASYTTGSETRSMRSAGVAADGLRVKMPNAGTFSSSCILRFEAVDAQNTRITPDCGDTGAAISDAAARFVELEIGALVRQTLTGEPVDADRLAKEMVAVVQQSLPQAQAEGFAPDEKWVREQQEAAIRRVESEQAGWAN